MKNLLISCCALVFTSYATLAVADRDRSQRTTSSKSTVSLPKSIESTTAVSEHSEDRETVDSSGESNPATGNRTPTGNGQLLAAQCFQCHGPNGRSKGEIDSIAGKSASDLYGDLIEMKQKQKVEIMHQQAKSYTDAELQAIANYLSTLN